MGVITHQLLLYLLRLLNGCLRVICRFRGLGKSFPRTPNLRKLLDSTAIIFQGLPREAETAKPRRTEPSDWVGGMLF